MNKEDIVYGVYGPVVVTLELPIKGWKIKAIQHQDKMNNVCIVIEGGENKEYFMIGLWKDNIVT
jgi:hypothetical protein